MGVLFGVMLVSVVVVMCSSSVVVLSWVLCFCVYRCGSDVVVVGSSISVCLSGVRCV